MKKKPALMLTATAVLGLSLTLLTSVGAARDATGSFACPNPKVLPLGKIFGANRGTTFCNDGARATVIIAGKPRLTLVGGVCWRNKKDFEVGIGTVVTNGPKKSDPAGLWLIDVKPGDLIGDTLQLSRGTYDWTGPVKVTLTGKNKGTFAATATGAKVNGRLTGSFTCKRVLYAPEQ
jgi:hypothetical protein